MEMASYDRLTSEAALEARKAYHACAGEYARSIGREDLGHVSDMWDGGVDQFNTKRKAVWPQLANFCRKYGVGVHAYIRFCFRMSRRICSPRDIMSERAVRQYLTSSASRDIKILDSSDSDEFRSEMIMALSRHIRPAGQSDQDAGRQVAESLLMDQGHCFSSLFRLVMASRFGLRDVMEFWLIPASMQYWEAREEYQALYGDLLPKCVEDTVTAMTLAHLRDRGK